mmetsp:Transcript_4195/g.8716  ORF Transcript_4195/g.8716 Transcript_4195/m.8716 type:complete len:204 (-) Transcript_4195:37-648(-)
MVSIANRRSRGRGHAQILQRMDERVMSRLQRTPRRGTGPFLGRTAHVEGIVFVGPMRRWGLQRHTRGRRRRRCRRRIILDGRLRRNHKRCRRSRRRNARILVPGGIAFLGSADGAIDIGAWIRRKFLLVVGIDGEIVKAIDDSQVVVVDVVDVDVVSVVVELIEQVQGFGQGISAAVGRNTGSGGRGHGGKSCEVFRVPPCVD